MTKKKVLSLVLSLAMVIGLFSIQSNAVVSNQGKTWMSSDGNFTIWLYDSAEKFRDSSTATSDDLNKFSGDSWLQDVTVRDGTASDTIMVNGAEQQADAVIEVNHFVYAEGETALAGTDEIAGMTLSGELFGDGEFSEYKGFSVVQFGIKKAENYTHVTYGPGDATAGGIWDMNSVFADANSDDGYAYNVHILGTKWTSTNPYFIIRTYETNGTAPTSVDAFGAKGTYYVKVVPAVVESDLTISASDGTITEATLLHDLLHLIKDLAVDDGRAAVFYADLLIGRFLHMGLTSITLHRSSLVPDVYAAVFRLMEDTIEGVFCKASSLLGTIPLPVQILGNLGVW